jgi:chemotaxis protein histidine kinase CheA
MATEAWRAEADRSTAQQVQSELEAAQEAIFEHARLSGRHATAESALAAAQAELARALEALEGEAADVQKLEDFSPTLIWATMRGNRDERLEVERAEHRAAEYRVAAARAAVNSADRERTEVRRALAALGDVTARRTAALAAKEAWVVSAGADGADELGRLATEVGTTRGELTELQEVARAAQRAEQALNGALAHLDSASNWAAYDTFGGGGFFSDMMKREKMDQAVVLMRNADETLRALTRELGDLGEKGVGGIASDSLEDMFDVWFDNIFSDWSVMSRIDEARGRVRAALSAVDDVRQGAATRTVVLEGRLGNLGMRRERLLTGSAG